MARVKGSVAGSRYESVRPARHGPACGGPPRSAAKVEAMAARFARRQSLHSPGDECDHAGRWLGMLCLAGAVLRPDDPALPERMRRQVTRRSVSDPSTEKKQADCNGKQTERKAFAVPGDRFRRAREMAGLSLYELSRRSGVGAGRLHEIERRETTPCLWSIHRVSLALRVCPDWLACIAREGGVVVCLCA